MKKRALLVVVALVFAAASLSAQSESAQIKLAAKRYLESGKKAFEEKYYGAAIEGLGLAIYYNPKLTEAYIYLAKAYIAYYDQYNELSSLDGAITNCTKAIKLAPKNAATYNDRGLAYYKKKDYDQAIADYTQAIKLDPKYALVYRNRGLAYENKGDNNQAIMDYTQALKLDPKNAATYIDRGVAYEKKKDYDQAIADYTEAIKLDPKYTLAYRNRGLAYFNKKDYDQAIADFTEAIRLNPKDSLTNYRSRGNAHYNKEDYDRAIADYTQVIQYYTRVRESAPHLVNSSVLATVYHWRGRAYSNKEDYDQAIKDYTEAIRYNPTKDAPAYYYRYRGDAYQNKGNYDQAVKDFEDVLRLDPKNAEAKKSLENARVAAAQKKKQETEQVAEQAAETKRTNAANLERLKTKVNFNGSYVNTSRGGWAALRFVDQNSSLGKTFRKDAPQALVIYSDGRTMLYPCWVNENDIVVPFPGGAEKLKVLNNNSLQSGTSSFSFIPFQSLNGKTYSLVQGGNKTIRVWSFSGKNVTAKSNNGTISGGDEWTYTFENGMVTLFFKGKEATLLTAIGPYLMSGFGELWAIDD